MRKTGFLYDENYLLHETGPFHPETSKRLPEILKGVSSLEQFSSLHRIRGVESDQKWIETNHDIRYILRFEEACLMGMTEIDYPDNQMCSETFNIAKLALGGVLETIRLLMEGTIDNAFCAVRPPGHHAERDRAMGFCYFNNIAIAAKYLRQEWKVDRVAIIDIDVHHGNGTQHSFEYDPTVLYCSIHEHPSFAFPGTGREFETGAGEGEGFTVNCPILPGQGDSEYRKHFEKHLLPAIDNFAPNIVLVSAGFDAHEEDDMSGIRLSTEAFTFMMERILEIADKHADGKLISILEGGYCLERLPELAANHVNVLTGK